MLASYFFKLLQEGSAREKNVSSTALRVEDYHCEIRMVVCSGKKIVGDMAYYVKTGRI